MSYLKINTMPVVQLELDKCAKAIEALIGTPVYIRVYSASRTVNNGSKHVLKDIVCDVFGVSEKQIFYKTRKTAIKEARQVYCYLCRELLHLSLVEIASDINQDHTTVISSQRRIQSLIDIIHHITDKIDSCTKEYLTIINSNHANKTNN
jgi:chromosomal replication initiation ATPase DnaA